MLTLAWRNLWRNKRRTLITAASIFFAVFLSIIMRGFHMGAWNNLIDSVLHSYSGYVQIHSKDYWDNKTLDYTFEYNEDSFKTLTRFKQIKTLIPRLESFSLASSGDKTKGVIVIGIKPDVENEFSHLENRIVEGRYCTSLDTGVMLSQRLAKYLNLKVNDSIVLLSQGYQGMSANGLFKIIGIVKLPAQEFDNQVVYMPLPVAQDFYSAPNLLTSLVVDINDPRKMNQTITDLKEVLNDSNYEVMGWEEMFVELYQQRVSDEGGGLIMLALLYIIVGFGVFGTVLMMVAERKREFAIMVTVGMKRLRLVKLVGYELILICIIGVIAGFIGSIPVIVYFHLNPIYLSGELAKVYEVYGMEPVLPVAWQTDYMFQQVINVSSIILVVLICPLYSVFKMNIVKAIRK
jgi:ABC-type lipoprotein release transport system permease subunit